MNNIKKHSFYLLKGFGKMIIAISFLAYLLIPGAITKITGNYWYLLFYSPILLFIFWMHGLPEYERR